MGGRMWVWVGTEESMQDLALHHKEYTFAATNGTFLNTSKKTETLGTPPAINPVHSKSVNSRTSANYSQHPYDAVTNCLKN